MQEIVHQLGELFLQAVPTVLIVLAFYVMLRALFFKPLLAVMAERDARTVGARKAAADAEGAAGVTQTGRPGERSSMTRGARWKFLGSTIAILLFMAISAHAAEEGGNAT